MLAFKNWFDKKTHSTLYARVEHLASFLMIGVIERGTDFCMVFFFVFGTRFM